MGFSSSRLVVAACLNIPAMLRADCSTPMPWLVRASELMWVAPGRMWLAKGEGGWLCDDRGSRIWVKTPFKNWSTLWVSSPKGLCVLQLSCLQRMV